MYNYCKNISISLVVFIFAIFVFSSLGFICHVPINNSYIIFSSIISTIILYFLNNEEKFYIKFFAIQLLIFYGIILLSSTVAMNFMDLSGDGCRYHQDIIFLLKNGYNPIYDNLINVIKNLDFQYKTVEVWLKSYPKISEIISANFYCIFNKIEIGKCVNYILATTSFCLAYFVISNKNSSKKEILYNVLISLLLILNPVCICQFITYYVDGNFYYLFLNVVLSTIYLFKDSNKFAIFCLIANLVLFANVKIGALFLTIFLLFILPFIWLLFKEKVSLLKIFFIEIVTIFLICLSGINPYYTNLKAGHHIFHPVLGSEKVDIMEYTTPKILKNKHGITKFIISITAKSSNNLDFGLKEIWIKMPFSFEQNEKYKFPDIRLSGFGILFSEILFLCLFSVFFLRFEENTDDKKIFFTILSFLILVNLINPESWWARYNPALWEIPILILFYYFKSIQKNISFNIFIFCIIALILTNCIFVLAQNLEADLRFSKFINNQIEENFSKTSINKVLPIIEYSYFIKLKERNIPFEIIDESYYQQHRNEFKEVNTVTKQFKVKKGK